MEKKVCTCLQCFNVATVLAESESDSNTNNCIFGFTHLLTLKNITYLMHISYLSLTRDVHISYTRGTFEDFGGYADPKDVKRPEK